jgi:hypothetical protein
MHNVYHVDEMRSALLAISSQPGDMRRFATLCMLTSRAQHVSSWAPASLYRLHTGMARTAEMERWWTFIKPRVLQLI